MYINEVERLDGFGQEIFSVKVADPADPGPFVLQLSHNGAAVGEPAMTGSRPERPGFLVTTWH